MLWMFLQHKLADPTILFRTKISTGRNARPAITFTNMKRCEAEMNRRKIGDIQYFYEGFPESWTTLLQNLEVHALNPQRELPWKETKTKN